VKIANIARDVRPHALDNGHMMSRDSGAAFTPGRFFLEAGTLIAICLGLGLLMRVLLG
jgi:hypothetical protein